MNIDNYLIIDIIRESGKYITKYHDYLILHKRSYLSRNKCFLSGILGFTSWAILVFDFCAIFVNLFAM